MARPSKYNWASIQEAYEGGIDKDEIVNKFKIPKKLLNNRIAEKKWEVKGHLKADIDEFSDTWHKTAQNLENMSIPVQEIVVDRINTQILDNELIENNRKLAKMLQGVIVSNRNSINLQNIKAVSGTLRDIESMANPQASAKIDINNTNAQQTNNLTKAEISQVIAESLPD